MGSIFLWFFSLRFFLCVCVLQGKTKDKNKNDKSLNNFFFSFFRLLVAYLLSKNYYSLRNLSDLHSNQCD